MHDQMKMLKIDGRDIAQNALIDAYGRVGETAEVVRIYEQNLFNLGEERARLATREGVAKAFANVGSTEGVLSIMEAVSGQRGTPTFSSLPILNPAMVPHCWTILSEKR